ncbi:exonuclease domain-containing protein [Rummeliibacillus pycnus]|uniref:exonuclease domain-containing protein n=1 Tax=Rummeliibacillus pycnus TaxID=101070 RepID=UPI000C9A4500|nr:exonuclease domain-containing protein [Rummeliibacillus pycnus]
MAFESFQQLLRSIQGRRNTGGFADIQNPQQIAFLRGLQKEIKHEEALSTPLSELKVVVFDIETTGFFPEKGDKILSIGAIKMSGSTIYHDDTFYSLLFTEMEIPSDIVQLTGIQNDDIKNAPLASNVLLQFLEFAKDSTLVAHHANHERSFFKHAYTRLFKTPFKQRIIDTTFLFKIVDSQLDLVKLEDFCKYNDIKVVNRHHALGDAILTAKLWSLYLERARNIGCDTLQDIYDRYARL